MPDKSIEEMMEEWATPKKLREIVRLERQTRVDWLVARLLCIASVVAVVLGAYGIWGID